MPRYDEIYCGLLTFLSISISDAVKDLRDLNPPKRTSSAERESDSTRRVTASVLVQSDDAFTKGDGRKAESGGFKALPQRQGGQRHHGRADHGPEASGRGLTFADMPWSNKIRA
jgi:hypothetical protein